MNLPLRVLWLLIGVGVSAVEFGEVYKTGELSYALYGAGFSFMTVAWVVRPLSLRANFSKSGMEESLRHSKKLTIGPSWLHAVCVVLGMVLLWAGIAAAIKLKP